MGQSRRTFLLGVPVLAAAALLPSTATVATATPPHQSPIHIRSRRAVAAPDLPELVIDYPDHVDLHVHYVSRDSEDDQAGCGHRGPEEVVEAAVPAGAASVRLGDTRFELLQFHFHTRAEHLLDGRRFPAEQHFVHRGPNGETLVLGLFLEPGGRGELVQDTVLGNLPAECAPELDASGDLAASLPRELSTFRYDGSLTTDPYSESVSWLVLARPQRVAAATLENHRRLFPDGNAREVQELNDRVVQYREQR